MDRQWSGFRVCFSVTKQNNKQTTLLVTLQAYKESVCYSKDRFWVQYHFKWDTEYWALACIFMFVFVHFFQDLWICSQEISEWDWKSVPSVCRTRPWAAGERYCQLRLKSHDRVTQKVRKKKLTAEWRTWTGNQLPTKNMNLHTPAPGAVDPSCGINFCTDCTAGCRHQRLYISIKKNSPAGGCDYF